MMDRMAPRVLLIDNYDSFVHNLARYLAELGCETEVVRNDRLSVAAVAERAATALVISPVPVRLRRRASACPLFENSRARYRFWVSVSGTRRSPRRSGAVSSGARADPRPCLARST